MEKLELIKNNLFIGAFVSFAIFAILYFCAIQVSNKQKDIVEKIGETHVQQRILEDIEWEKQNAEWNKKIAEGEKEFEKNKKINEQLTKELDERFKKIDEQLTQININSKIIESYGK